MHCECAARYSIPCHCPTWQWWKQIFRLLTVCRCCAASRFRNGNVTKKATRLLYSIPAHVPLVCLPACLVCLFHYCFMNVYGYARHSIWYWARSADELRRVQCALLVIGRWGKKTTSWIAHRASMHKLIVSHRTYAVRPMPTLNAFMVVCAKCAFHVCWVLYPPSTASYRLRSSLLLSFRFLHIFLFAFSCASRVYWQVSVIVLHLLQQRINENIFYCRCRSVALSVCPLHSITGNNFKFTTIYAFNDDNNDSPNSKVEMCECFSSASRSHTPKAPKPQLYRVPTILHDSRQFRML